MEEDKEKNGLRLENQDDSREVPKYIEEDDNAVNKFFRNLSRDTSDFVQKKRVVLVHLSVAIFNLLILAYFIVALLYWQRNTPESWELCNGFGFFLIIICLVYSFLVYFQIVKRFFGKFLKRVLLQPIYNAYKKVWKVSVLRWLLYLLIIGGIVTFLVLDTKDSPHRLKSLIGFFTLLAGGFVFSKSPSKIFWRPVFWGILLQFIIGLFTIRLSVGRDIFQCIGDKVATFLNFTRFGAAFVFGDDLVNRLNVFAFSALPTIVFFSMLVEILFYLGTMQWMCKKMGWVLQVTLGTTICENMICVANTFVGMTESPLIIRPYIPLLTKSEFHAIMGSGFATVSGTVLNAYICFGAEPAHLLTASIMSAPAALSFSKLFYPETEESKTSSGNIKVIKSEETSILSAASKGCSLAIPLAFNIAANLIGFVSFVAFINALFAWFGGLVGLEYLRLEWMMGKIFIPLSWIMGVPWEECEIVGELIGLKTVINEFVAYQRLGVYKDQGLLSVRGEVIATYSLCGFTNPSSLGILISALSTMAPDRRSDIISVAGRAFVTGCAVCFMTACIAGVLLTDDAVFVSNNNATCSVY